MARDKPLDFAENARSLTYPSNVGAPAFTVPDVVTHKTDKTNKASKQLQAKFEELRDQYFELVELAENTKLVYNAEYNFVPVVGHVYHLYDAGYKTFLSIIRPEDWAEMEHLGSFRYTSEATWDRVDNRGT